ncbi:dnaJ homolog subfamily C member 22-like [Mercenaria mercenaria]|uniref:dnaJ homolog subfamily C member 22-like n=1 Tax=Mercenaria mercenaria TaxID=6596 RepID=UPI00234E619B|nr:dnaJ homolog subfamily C member 22-like [Mercenaria mercenaria]
MANLTVTYILWFCGGIFGLHHLYLNRPQHCFIWFVTWGGMVIGWLSEVTQLKDYVEEANEGKDYKERMKVIKTHKPKPGFSLVVLGGQLMIGHQLGGLMINAVPEYYTVETWYGPYLSHILAAVGASVGVHLASNIGPQEAPLLQPLLAAVATFPTAFVLYNRRTLYTLLCVVVASYVSSEYSRWVTKKKPNGFIGNLKTCACVGLGLMLYGGLWTSNMYHNMQVNTLNGTRIYLREAVYNFAKTQPWDEAREVVQDLIPCLKMYSMETCQYQILSRLTELSDPQRDAWAFSVLGFERYPTQKQVNSHCRKISSKWHPDRFTRANKTEKEAAEKKFIDIQKACGMLSKLKSRRERKNTWSDGGDHSETIFTGTSDVNTEYDDVGTQNNGADYTDDYDYEDDNEDDYEYDRDIDESDIDVDHNEDVKERTDSLSEESKCDSDGEM